MESLTVQELFTLNSKVRSKNKLRSNIDKIYILGNYIVATNGYILVVLIRENEVKNGSYRFPENINTLITKSSAQKLRATDKSVQMISELYSKVNSSPGITRGDLQYMETISSVLRNLFEDEEESRRIKPFNSDRYSKAFSTMKNIVGDNRNIYRMPEKDNKGSVFIFSKEDDTTDPAFEITEMLLIMPVLKGSEEDENWRIKTLREHIDRMGDFNAGNQEPAEL